MIIHTTQDIVLDIYFFWALSPKPNYLKIVTLPARVSINPSVYLMVATHA